MIICPCCSRPTNIVNVHGHGQCQWCHSAIETCCTGETVLKPEPVSARLPLPGK